MCDGVSVVVAERARSDIDMLLVGGNGVAVEEASTELDRDGDLAVCEVLLDSKKLEVLDMV